MYLLIFKEKKQLFSFYINSAKKNVTVGGSEGDILMPPSLRGYEFNIRKELDFNTRDYVWTIHTSSDKFTKNGKKIKDGEMLDWNDIIAIEEYSFSLSGNANHEAITLEPEKSDSGGKTIVIDEERKTYQYITLKWGKKSKTFTFRNDRILKIGREKVDFVINRSEVSSEHMILTMQEKKISFWCKGKNGTYVNGMNVENGELTRGKYSFLIAGKYDLAIAITEEKASESFYKGSLAPLFERVEQWVQQPELFKTHPIILFTGDSGTGKEIFAEFAHDISGRSGKFIPFNAASIPENLVESELFGTSKGGFTGAEERKGAFLLADKGTLFLDEIAEMPLNLQSKLLRVIEDWKVRKVGEKGSGRKVDLNVILATNKNLSEEIKKSESSFRKDLYFRISTLHINIPPLKDRKEDILPLARHFYYSLKGKKLEMNSKAEEKFLSYDWPGNVRELKSVMTRFAYLNKDILEASDIDF